jgi:hypothetical protein
MQQRDFSFLKEKYTTEGAREVFERICHSILKKKHNDKEVKMVKANPGDKGIDVYVGNIIYEEIIVYQCKYFTGNL